MKVVKRIIVVNLRIEGLHHWADAKKECPASGFLQNPHRHMFHIQAEKEVEHNDRDIEFIVLKRAIGEFIQDKHIPKLLCNGQGMIDFGGMSCEMVAEEIAHEFGLSKCIVLEDGENGGGVICQD